MTVLHTRGLRAGYRKGAAETILFDDVNLQLPAGRLVCFMGPNGVGKSSLIRTLAGLQPPLAGEVIIHRDDRVVERKEHAVALVLTERISAGNLSAREFVTYGRYPHLSWHIQLNAEDHAQIDAALSRVKVQALAHRPVAELSDGQMQMVMIARALAQATPVLLLDEPTAHLDLNNRVEIMNLLRTLAREEKKSILVATHELDLALQTADEVWLATPEKKILTGIPEDLVLEGAFDRVFQLKGFDLRTGKMHHHAWRNISVAVYGEGFQLLWTRNALEREGFLVSDAAAVEISVVASGAGLRWQMGNQSFDQIQSLILHLTTADRNTAGIQ